jgi:hypothetical protein
METNVECRLKNEEVEIRRTNESCISTNKVSFLASRLLPLVSWFSYLASKFYSPLTRTY